MKDDLDERVTDKESFLVFLEETVTSGLYQNVLENANLDILKKLWNTRQH